MFLTQNETYIFQASFPPYINLNFNSQKFVYLTENDYLCKV